MSIIQRKTLKTEEIRTINLTEKWAKDIYTHIQIHIYTYIHTHMALKHKKRYSILLDNEMQIKATQRCYFSPIRLAKIKQYKKSLLARETDTWRNGHCQG